MKKFSVLACAAVAAMVFTGCTSVKTSDGATSTPQVGTEHPGYVAEYTHKNERVNGSAQINILFGIFSWGTEGYADNSKLSAFSFLPSPDNFAKSAAVYNTCREHKADTLLGTRYVLTTTDYWIFKTVKCEVAGFPAVMTGVTKKSPYIIGSEGKLVWLAEKPIIVQ